MQEEPSKILPGAFSTIDEDRSLTLQQKVFKQLMADDANNHCFDCGWNSPDYVSINHGIFICFNCAIGIHQSHYPVEVSCVKSIAEDQFNNT
jgi:hypothetical protein